MAKLKEQFDNPPGEYRGAPFWSWNDDLQVAELSRQVRDMKAHGMGGFFMHSRDGLETVYMGPEWIDCIHETVRVAKETGMSAWLYDEDRWPSGAAGGLVPARGGDAFRAKVITVEECQLAPEKLNDVLAIFAAQVEGTSLSGVRRLEPAKAVPAKGETLLVFRREISGPSEWYNNDAPSDNLNPDSVAAFIDITYEAYRKEIGDEFGKTVPGIFTDEPNVFAPTVLSKLRALPWTDALPAYFLEHRGHELLDLLPWLFYDGESTGKARHDYWQTISQLYTEAYSKQLGEWCGRNNLAFTGHYLCENELGLALIRGGSVMPHYLYQQVPGIDMLTEQNHEFLTIKQCSSVASQFGRQRVLSETYGCSGWEFTFEGQKWNGDWQYVLGVNLRCQHLALYSLRGCRKRDYPPAFNYNTTWWKYNKVVEDYFARVGYMMSQGEAIRDVLLLHPMSSVWALMRQGEDSTAEANAYGERLNTFAQALLATHYDFDFGDEQIMAEHAAVKGDQLTVGQAPYRVVILPPDTRTLLASTVDLLEQFVAAGGKIIVMAPVPTMIEAEASDRFETLLAHENVTIVPQVSGLQAALENTLPRRVSLKTPYGQEAARLLYMQRTIDGKQAYFIVNNDREHGHDLEIALEGSGRVEEWDALTGELRPIAAFQKDGHVRFQQHIGAAGSKLYVVDPTAPAVEGATEAPPSLFLSARKPSGAVLLGPQATFTRTDPNVLTLDMCSYRMQAENGDWSEWSGEMEVWRAQDAIRQALGMRPNYYNGLPQRYKWACQPHENDGRPVEFRFFFDVQDEIETPTYLLVEGAKDYAISLDGYELDNTPVGWYLDRSFHKVMLPAIDWGTHELVLNCGYTNHMEVEDCFLIGDFGVGTDRSIIAEPAFLHYGDWTSQGYLHYPGGMIYHHQMEYDPTIGKRVRLYLGAYSAVDIAVQVNGSLAGHIPWISENGMDITDLLGPGLNNVDIEVVSSPRNMLGPLHLATGREAWTDWRSFRRTDGTYTPDYVVQPWGLIGQVRLQYE